MKKGFSLVELSIVLVILGLLTGGILAGQSLIRAAQLRSVSTEYSRYITATHAFRDKYFAIPGDFRDATRFWGRMNGNADCITNSSAAVNAAGACDGNGSGFIDGAAAHSQSGDIFQYWRHLAAAGLIEGSYTGLAGTGSGSHCVLGTNCPASRLGTAGWGVRAIASYFAGNGSDWAGNYGNFFDMGSASSNGTPQGAVLLPEEAWNIDTKIDDGKPGTGSAIIAPWPACSIAASATDFNAAYRLDNQAAACMFHFLRAF